MTLPMRSAPLPEPRTPDPHEAPAIRWGILAPGGIAHDFAVAVAAGHGLQGRRGRLAQPGAGPGLRRRVRRSAGLRLLRGARRRRRGRRRLRRVAALRAPRPRAARPRGRQAGPRREGVHPQRRRGRASAREPRAAGAARRRGDVEPLPAALRRRAPGRRGRAASASSSPSSPTTASASTPTARPGCSPELAGGALLDLGVYPVSFADLVLGAPSSVSPPGTLTDLGVDATTTDHRHRAPAGSHGVLTSTMAGVTPCTAVVGHRGAARAVRPLLRRRLDDPARGPQQRVLDERPGGLPRLRGFSYQAAEFARCLVAGETESPLHAARRRPCGSWRRWTTYAVRSGSLSGRVRWGRPSPRRGDARWRRGDEDRVS